MQAKKAALIGTLITVPVLMPASRPLAEEGLRVTLKVGERLEYKDKSGFTSRQDDDGFRATTDLNFGLLSETKNQSFSLDVDTGIALDFDDSSSNDTLDDPSVKLSYSTENRSTLLTFDTTYRRADTNSSNFFDELSGQNIITGEGTRTTASARTGLTVGRDGPVTGEFNYFYLSSRFSDDPNPNRSDETVNSFDGRVTLRISPVFSTYVFADWRKEDQELATASDQTTQSYGIGSTYELSPVLSLTTEISFDENESVGNGIVTSSNDGAGYLLGLSHTVANGSYDFDFSSSETINGTRYQASVGRNLELRAGILSFSLGAVKNDGVDAQLIATLGIDYELSPASRINVDLSQTPDVNSNDRSTINTRLNVDYTRELNALSSLTAGLQLANSNELGPGAVDQSVFEASLSYNRSVGADWDLVSGVSYEVDQRNGRADRKTSTIFAGLEKTFNLRP